ncbi:MAG: O-antigen/teichoic acid export membrane protein [Arenicella sp.]|jgi:O-antigen/teichoic acid export membrane protein
MNYVPKFTTRTKAHMRSNFWLMLERLVNILSAFFIGVLVIRHLGPAQFGALSYIMAVAFFLTAITKFGLDMIVVKRIVQFPEKTAAIIASAWLIRILSALMTIVFVAISLIFVELASIDSFYILLIAFGGLSQSFWVIEPALNANENYRSLALSKITQSIISALLRIVLILLNAPLHYFVVAIVFDYLLLSFIYAVSQKVLLSFILLWKNINSEELRFLYRAALPILLSSLSVALYTKMDQVMIAHLLDIRSVGIYSAAVRIIEATYFLPVIFSSVCLPILVRAKLSGNERYEEYVRNIFSLMILAGAIVGSFLFIFAGTIVTALFGADYKEAVEPLRVLSLGTVFVYIGSLTTTAMIANNLQRVIFIRTLSAAILNILLNYFLILKFGAIGASYATLITFTFAAFLFDGLSKNTHYLMVLKLKGLVPQKSLFNLFFREG